MKKFFDWIEESNIKHCELIRKGSEYRNREMAKYWVNLLSKAKNCYYAGEPIMDDMTYDHFENNLKLLDSENPFLERVGVIAEFSSNSMGQLELI